MVDKKLRVLLITVFLCIVILSSAGVADTWDGSVASSFAGGNGTADNPYIISNCSQLAYLAKVVNDMHDVNYSRANYSVTDSLDLNCINWPSIG